MPAHNLLVMHEVVLEFVIKPTETCRLLCVNLRLTGRANDAVLPAALDRCGFARLYTLHSRRTEDSRRLKEFNDPFLHFTVNGQVHVIQDECSRSL